MPDGVSTVRTIGSRGFDISGSSYLVNARRDSTGNDTFWASTGGSLTLVAEENMTAIPDGSGDLFSGLSTSDSESISSENAAFEGFGPSDQNGIYARIDETLTKVCPKWRRGSCMTIRC